MFSKQHKPLGKGFFSALTGCLLVLCWAMPPVMASYLAQMSKPVPTVRPPFSPFGVTRVLQHAPRSHMMMGDILMGANKQKQLLLWSMYPASVRGRVFDGAGGDPLLNGGGNGSGAGW